MELRIEENGSFTAITLAAEARRNALSPPLLAQLTEAVVTANPKLPLVLQSTSHCFCAGLDRSYLRNASSKFDELSSYFLSLHHLYSVIYAHPEATIALIDKIAVGGGFGLAFCHDLIALREDTRLKLPGGDFANLARLARPPIATKIPEVSIEEKEELILFGSDSRLKDFTFPLGEMPSDRLPDRVEKITKALSFSRCAEPMQLKFQRLCREAYELVIRD